jgi:hypothetical protein
MALDPAIAEARRLETRDAASAFLEDFDHTRELLSSRFPVRRDARHISAILRRLLVESDLHTIAGPRLGRIEIVGPNLDLAYLNIADRKPIAFYASIFAGLGIAPAYATHYSPSDAGSQSVQIDLKPFSVDGFRDQKVIWFRDTWISRTDLIRYVANEKAGVHSQQERRVNTRTISLLEMIMTMSLDSKGICNIKMADVPPIAPRSTYRGNALNPVLLEMILAASALFSSPDIIRLASYVRSELR